MASMIGWQIGWQGALLLVARVVMMGVVMSELDADGGQLVAAVDVAAVDNVDLCVFCGVSGALTTGKFSDAIVGNEGVEAVPRPIRDSVDCVEVVPQARSDCVDGGFARGIVDGVFTRGIPRDTGRGMWVTALALTVLPLEDSARDVSDCALESPPGVLKPPGELPNSAGTSMFSERLVAETGRHSTTGESGATILGAEMLPICWVGMACRSQGSQQGDEGAKIQSEFCEKLRSTSKQPGVELPMPDKTALGEAAVGEAASAKLKCDAVFTGVLPSGSSAGAGGAVNDAV